MATLDHIILKVNDLAASVKFYTEVLGFTAEGTEGPFTILRVGPDCQLQLAPWGTPGFEHYAFAVSTAEFEEIFGRIKVAGIAHGPTFDSVGANAKPGKGALSLPHLSPCQWRSVGCMDGLSFQQIFVPRRQTNRFPLVTRCGPHLLRKLRHTADLSKHLARRGN